MRVCRILAVVFCSLPSTVFADPMPPSIKVAGIPIYNVETFSTASKDTKQEYFLALRDGSTDAQVHAICASSPGICLGEGHPDEGGIPFLNVYATMEELTAIMSRHKDVLDFAEPALDIGFPPIEEGTPEDLVAADNFQDDVSDTEALVEAETNSTNSGHYVLFCCPWGGKGPYRSYQAADSAFLSLSGKDLVMMTSDRGSGSQKCQPNICHQNSAAIKNQYDKCISTPAACPVNGMPDNGDRRRRTDSNTGKNPTSVWGLDRIDDAAGLDKDYSPPLDGTGSHIYVVDTGVRTTHKDFEGRAIPTIDTSSGNVTVCDPKDTRCAADCPARGRSRCGHGSHCAGTAGGHTYGVAKGATIHAVKVMDSSEQIFTSRIAMAFDWVAANGQRPAVMSVSLGSNNNGKPSVTMKRSVKRATEAGITVVVASGNDGFDACKQTPADVELALVVASTARDGTYGRTRTKMDARSGYSNYGSCCDIFAPGDNILSVSSATDTGSLTMSGTSMAAPHVSGAVAMLLQACPTYTVAQVLEELKKYAIKDKVTDPKGTPNYLLNVAGFPGGNPPQRPSNCPRPAPAPAPPNLNPPDSDSSRRRTPRRRSSSRSRSSRRRAPRRRSKGSRRRTPRRRTSQRRRRRASRRRGR